MTAKSGANPLAYRPNELRRGGGVSTTAAAISLLYSEVWLSVSM
jgi:hypothetical protein